MKFDIKFKSINYSKSLVEYCQDRFEKIEKFEFKPLTVHITFSNQRHSKVAEVYISGYQGSFKAKSASESFNASIDMCMKKLKRQMEKEKAKVQNHRHYERSSEAQLEAQIRAEVARNRKAA